MKFDACVHLWNYHPKQGNGYVHLPRSFLEHFCNLAFLTHHQVSLCPKGTIDLPSVTIGLSSFSADLYNRIIKYTLLLVCEVRVWLLSLSVIIWDSSMLHVPVICFFLLLISALSYGYTTMVLPFLQMNMWVISSLGL